RERVDRRRVEHAAAVQVAPQDRAVEQRAQVVHDGIARVHPDRLVPVSFADGDQPRRHLVICLVPRDLLPLAPPASHRPPQPIRIVIELLQAVRLRTDVAARERIALVATHRENRLALDLNGEPACGLTEWTDPMNRLANRHVTPPLVPLTMGPASALLPNAAITSWVKAAARIIRVSP